VREEFEALFGMLTVGVARGVVSLGDVVVVVAAVTGCDGDGMRMGLG
jgi:hypothetical protein